MNLTWGVGSHPLCAVLCVRPANRLYHKMNFSKRVSLHHDDGLAFERSCNAWKRRAQIQSPSKRQLKCKSRILRDWQQHVQGFDSILHKSKDCLLSEYAHYWQMLDGHVQKTDNEFGVKLAI